MGSPRALAVPGERSGLVPPGDLLPGPAVGQGQPAQGGPRPQRLCQGPGEEQGIGEGLRKVAGAPGGRREALRLDADWGGRRGGAAGWGTLLAQASAPTAGGKREGGRELSEEGKEARGWHSVGKGLAGGPWERRGWRSLLGPQNSCPSAPEVRAVPGMATRGQQRPGLWRTGTCRRLRALTWAGRARRGAHHPSRAARGPGWGAATSQGAVEGLPGHILVGRNWGLRPGPLLKPSANLTTPSDSFEFWWVGGCGTPRGQECGRFPGGARQVRGCTWGASGEEGEAPQWGSGGCSGAGVLQATVEASLCGERVKGKLRPTPRSPCLPSSALPHPPLTHGGA